jgi:hypothetical protein
MARLRMGVVQPITVPPPGRQSQCRRRGWIARAAAHAGRRFDLLPGEFSLALVHAGAKDPAPAIAGAAAKHNVQAVFSTIEPIDPVKATAYNLTCMAFPDGRPLAR